MNTIIMCTRNPTGHSYLQKAMASVLNNIPQDRWQVRLYVDNGIGLVANKINALKECIDAGDELVAFVDDDDILLPNGLDLCENALSANSTIGIASTIQQRIDKNGRPGRLDTYLKDIPYAAIPGNVFLLHHLAVFRPHLIHVDVFKLATSLGYGIDELVKGYIALTSGAMLIPKVGYYWRNHPKQESKKLQNGMPIKEYLRSIATVDITQPIPTYYGTNSISG